MAPVISLTYTDQGGLSASFADDERVRRLRECGVACEMCVGRLRIYLDGILREEVDHAVVIDVFTNCIQVRDLVGQVYTRTHHRHAPLRRLEDGDRR